jgi:hypothetical protein
LNFDREISVIHISVFYTQWSKLQEVKLTDSATNATTWKLSNSGKYSTASKYMAQLISAPTSFVKTAPPPQHIFLLILVHLECNKDSGGPRENIQWGHKL